MSDAPHVLSTTYNYAKCILTACIIEMGVKKNMVNMNVIPTALHDSKLLYFSPLAQQVIYCNVTCLR
jgi:hypothetical protein